ncbi:phage antirepressor KilAC domain-containing protein [uncultured Megamonas sp.]|uniref:phage antirepressor KilAC domain-containing protein n=1 Tax=uncultured Megamonas sp. TaxID=286140 RepID=UPI00259B43E1|nr:phage antirepressor KilAC domain-containing protein [uncultured Megamonas sp.]
MNELLKVEVNENQEQVVNGRLLHEFLQISTPYTKWFGRMCEYGFIENIDYLTEDKNVRRTDGTIMPQKEINHTLKLNMAKELCMLARNERGKEARQYFIKCEEAWNSPEMIMSRALAIANKNLLMKDEQILKLMAENTEMKPKADYFDELVERNTLTNFRETAKLLHIGQNKFIDWLLNKKFIYRDIKGKLLAYSNYISGSKPYFDVKEQKNGNWSGFQTLITPQGREAFRLLLQVKENN